MIVGFVVSAGLRVLAECYQGTEPCEKALVYRVGGCTLTALDLVEKYRSLHLTVMGIVDIRDGKK